MVELLVAVAITGLIAGGIATTIYQVFGINTLSNNHMLAVRQVQNAGHFISHDAQMAQSIDDTSVLIEEDHPLWDLYDGLYNGQTQVLSLSWVGWTYDYGNNTRTNTYQVYYTYDSVNDKLWRYQTISIVEYDGADLEDPQPDDQNSTTFIAGYLLSILEGDIYRDGDKLIVVITASVGDATEMRTYEITPRPST